MTKPIVSFIVLILSIGFAFLYVKPAYSLVQERKSDIVSLTAILDNSTKIKTLIDQTAENLKSVNDTEQSRFSVFLPETIDTIRFANNIQHIGLSNGIILADIKVEDASNSSQAGASKDTGATQGLVSTFSLGSKIQQAQGGTAGASLGGVASTEKKYRATKASFTLISTYETFQLFLDNLEKSLGLINITSLSFAPVQEADVKKSRTPPPPLYQFAVSIETYSLK